MIEIKNVSMIFENTAKIKILGKSISPDEETAPREKALDNISMEIPDGCIYGFVGFNGAGKSTLMRLICGIYRTELGTIMLDGEKVFDNPSAKEKIFFVNDETIEYTNYTLDGLKNYYIRYYPSFDVQLFDRLVNMLGLPKYQKLSTFSKGMKRQSLVLIGLASKTKYLILDEAFDGLDPSMRALIKDTIVDEIRGRNATLIISSHNVAEIGDMCDKVLRLSKGKLVFADELDKVKSSCRKYQLAAADRVISAEEINGAGVVCEKYSAVGRVVNIIVKQGESDEITEKLNTLAPVILEEIQLTLEEMFVYDNSGKGGTEV